MRQLPHYPIGWETGCAQGSHPPRQLQKPPHHLRGWESLHAERLPVSGGGEAASPLLSVGFVCNSKKSTLLGPGQQLTLGPRGLGLLDLWPKLIFKSETYCIYNLSYFNSISQNKLTTTTFFKRKRVKAQGVLVLYTPFHSTDRKLKVGEVPWAEWACQVSLSAPHLTSKSSTNSRILVDCDLLTINVLKKKPL